MSVVNWENAGEQFAMVLKKEKKRNEKVNSGEEEKMVVDEGNGKEENEGK